MEQKAASLFGGKVDNCPVSDSREQQKCIANLHRKIGELEMDFAKRASIALGGVRQMRLFLLGLNICIGLKRVRRLLEKVELCERQGCRYLGYFCNFTVVK